jgi:ABC-2 type transport system permease protein
MSARVTLAVAARVLRQLRHDPRTVALLVIVPAALVTLLKFIFIDNSPVFDRLGGPLLGLFPFVSMFLVTSITMLRERTSGTLERLMTMPLSKLDLLVGYGIAFSLMAAAQVAVVSGVGFLALDLQVEGSPWGVFGLAVANALLGLALGLLLSAFATTEFQAVQFMPAFIFPQLLLCGLFVARAEMARPLELASYALPLTYAYDGLDQVTQGSSLGASFVLDVTVTLGVTVLALAFGALTLRRRTA